MKKLLVVLCFLYTDICAQVPVIKSARFFENDTMLEATIKLDINKFIASASKPVYMPADFSCKIGGNIISEKVRIMARGNLRRKICYMPPVKINFDNETSPVFKSLGTLKMVGVCKTGDAYDQLLLKEYLIYKIYNLLTKKSFRVRLLQLSYEDDADKKKTFTQHAFFIEDEKKLAKRNDCKQLKKVTLKTEGTDRDQMTLIALFQYMIGNTDWAVPDNHNIMLLQCNAASLPVVVPYDFDYSGFVNAGYATPPKELEIENVQERYYLGFPRTMQELNTVIDLFKQQKDTMYATVKNFTLLTSKNRDYIISYLDDFYKIINNENLVKYYFITKARTR